MNKILEKLHSVFKNKGYTDHDLAKSAVDYLQDHAIQVFSTENKNIILPVKEIAYAESVDDRSNFYTEDAIYHNVFGYEENLLLYNAYNFDTSHRSVVINLDKVKKYDSEMLFVYFDDNPTEASLKARMKYVYIKKIKDQVGLENNINYIPKGNKRILFT